MKREIKFRAWDKEKGEWYAPTHEAYKGNLWELFVSFSGDLCAHRIGGMEHESNFPDRYVLSQWTGLVDKSGKKIYEGDILRVDEYRYKKGDYQGYLGTVEYCATCCAGYRLQMIKCANNECLWNFSIVEVIGNVWQNPELLTN